MFLHVDTRLSTNKQRLKNRFLLPLSGHLYRRHGKRETRQTHYYISRLHYPNLTFIPVWTFQITWGRSWSCPVFTHKLHFLFVLDLQHRQCFWHFCRQQSPAYIWLPNKPLSNSDLVWAMDFDFINFITVKMVEQLKAFVLDFQRGHVHQ